MKIAARPAVRVLTVAVLLAGALASAQSQKDKKTPDYQTQADAAKWDLSQANATLRKCMDAFPKAYRVTANLNDSGRATIEITKDGESLYRWTGHAGSVFDGGDDVLYYADFHSLATGCRVVAVDLTTGKELWKVNLKCLGVRFHTKYSNQVNLCVQDMTALRVLGLESEGAYIEFVDRKTGKTVGHRLFSEEERK